MYDVVRGVSLTMVNAVMTTIFLVLSLTSGYSNNGHVLRNIVNIWVQFHISLRFVFHFQTVMNCYLSVLSDMSTRFVNTALCPLKTFLNKRNVAWRFLSSRNWCHVKCHRCSCHLREYTVLDLLLLLLKQCIPKAICAYFSICYKPQWTFFDLW